MTLAELRIELAVNSAAAEQAIAGISTSRSRFRMPRIQQKQAP